MPSEPEGRGGLRLESLFSGPHFRYEPLPADTNSFRLAHLQPGSDGDEIKVRLEVQVVEQDAEACLQAQRNLEKDDGTTRKRVNFHQKNMVCIFLNIMATENRTDVINDPRNQELSGGSHPTQTIQPLHPHSGQTLHHFQRSIDR